MSECVAGDYLPVRRRRSYHQLSYRQIAALPIGPIPDICRPPPASRVWMRRLRRRWNQKLGALLVVAGLYPTVTIADNIYFTYLTAKQELPTTAQLADGSTKTVTGVEKFDAQPLAATGTGPAFSSTFGTTNSAITGNFTGSYGILAADQYGGAGNTGRYITTFSSAGFSMKFTTTAALPGVNYFGMNMMALDDNNNIALYRNGGLLTSFNAAALRKVLGTCPNTSNPYCGNPTTAANNGEQYAYLNFFDLSGYFDEIRITQLGSSGGFETDNFTVGYREINTVFGTTIPVPEPTSMLVLASGLLGLTFLRRRKLARAG